MLLVPVLRLRIVYPAPRLLVAQTVNVCVHIRRDKATKGIRPADRSAASTGSSAPMPVAGGSWSPLQIQDSRNGKSSHRENASF
jgi:hypothetical protein